VSWPPRIGEILPHADSVLGIEEKLSAYCLNLDHEIGGPKARAFQRILGIGLSNVDYLAEALREGVLREPILDVRDNAPFGVLCEVRIPVAGRRQRRDRVAAVITAWELRHQDAAPRLVTAFIGGNL
jgi:hypothetical protein